MQIIVFLAPDQNQDGTYTMNYSDGTMLDSILEWKRAAGSGEPVEIGLVAFAPKEAKSVLREGLARGGDRALLLTAEPGWQEPWQLSQYLSKEIRAWGEYDLLCAGGNSSLTDAFLMTAEILGLPQVTQMDSFEKKGKRLTVKKTTGSEIQWLEVEMPCLLTNGWRKDLPGTVTFQDIQEALEKELVIGDGQEALGTAAAKGIVLASAPVKQGHRKQVCLPEQEAKSVYEEIQKKLAEVIYGG